MHPFTSKLEPGTLGHGECCQSISSDIDRFFCEETFQIIISLAAERSSESRWVSDRHFLAQTAPNSTHCKTIGFPPFRKSHLSTWVDGNIVVKSNLFPPNESFTNLIIAVSVKSQLTRPGYISAWLLIGCWFWLTLPITVILKKPNKLQYSSHNCCGCRHLAITKRS